LQKEFEGSIEFRWLDIEDEDDLVGAVDVTTFPTLLVTQGRDVRFFGAVAPHAAALKTLVASVARGNLCTIEDPGIHELVDWIRADSDVHLR
jgi:hypothetical protein